MGCRNCGATDHDVGDTVGCGHREGAAGGLGRVGQRGQAGFIHRGVGAFRYCRDHTGTVSRTPDRDGQLRRALVAVGILHRVVQRVGRVEARTQRLGGSTAVVQRVAPSAISVLRQSTVCVERRDDCGVSTPAYKRLRRIGTADIVAQHVAAERCRGGIFRDRATSVIDCQWHIVCNGYSQRSAGLVAVAVSHHHTEAVDFSRGRYVRCGAGQRVGPAIRPVGVGHYQGAIGAGDSATSCHIYAAYH